MSSRIERIFITNTNSRTKRSDAVKVYPPRLVGVSIRSPGRVNLPITCLTVDRADRYPPLRSITRATKIR